MYELQVECYARLIYGQYGGVEMSVDCVRIAHYDGSGGDVPLLECVWK